MRLQLNIRKWVEIAIMILFISFMLAIGVTLLKLVGLAILIIGFAMLLYYPDSYRFQPQHMALAGIILGVVLTVLGLLLLIFA